MTAVADANTANVDPAEALLERIFAEGLGAVHLATTYLGVRLGLFAALDEQPMQTVDELAAKTRLDPRYVQEWLQAEMIAGLITADDEDVGKARFRLAPGVHEVLVDEINPMYLGGLPMALVAVGQAMPQLVHAYASGGGVPMGAYGPEVIAAQAALNRPAFVNELASSWVPQVPGLHERLMGPDARAADVGCGVGWAAIELAKAYPQLHVDGYDSDEESVAQARRNAVDHGVDDQVRFETIDASSTPYGRDRYDVVFFFECLHDIARPVEALAAARDAVKGDGVVIVMDERTADTPQIGDPTETFLATVSAVWCLPQSRVVADCEAPGTLMRPATFESFVRRAGWSGYDVLDIEHPMFRFYRLT